MSRKSNRNRPGADAQASPAEQGSRARRGSRRGVVIGVIAALLLAVVAATFLPGGESTQPGDAARQAALASAHSPTLGDATARVHIVEFLDPACETCARFFPLAKQWMAENPGRIRLSVRHIPFHAGSDYVVRVLEASRRQDKYWQTLEALLATQALWAPNHTVEPGLVWQAIAGVGLDFGQALADMNAPEVTQRMDQDRSAAITLQVTATPEYFVNGRPLPSFGEQQLRDLVREELENAY